ncbi:hypothetical protein CS379_12815, partial [Methylobacterium frigidaeris]
MKFAPEIEAAQAQALIADRTGIRALDVREVGNASLPAPSPNAPEGGIVIDRFKVAIIQPQQDAGARVASLQAEGGVIVRPEFYLFAISELERRYAAWVREGLSILANGYPGAVTSP